MGLLSKEQMNTPERDLDAEYERLKYEVNADLDQCIGNKSKTKILLKLVQRKVAHLQHMCREAGEMDLVYESRAFLKSLNKMQWGMRSSNGGGGGGF